MSIGDEIRKARLACGLTQRGLARLIGVTHGLVGQWESDVKKPGRDNLLAVSQATLFSVEALSGLESPAAHGIVISVPLEIDLIRAFRRMSRPQQKNLVHFLRVSADVAGEMQQESAPAEI